ncbi:10 kDa heat shock protein, mitochondrial-like [Sorex araneus]|uniref:10 kDa heat shock protein, mitochondrial-like n=1 Tax=Sorex araneus TaxID=42254 RepID=UPI002433B179|nr:10 kDa heat shock protein, mitochondrial-like [Sorex araneus]
MPADYCFMLFEITIECIQDLSEDLEWKIIYVGSAESEEYNQVLDSVLVGSVPAVRDMLVFKADVPNPGLIPDEDALFPHSRGHWAGLRGVSAELGSAAVSVLAGQAFRKFLPFFDQVLVERSAAETVTKGGIVLPEKSQGKVLQATVVAVGSGSKGKGAEIQPVSVKVGDKVLLPEYRGTKVALDYKDYFLFRVGDILGKYVD